MAAEVDAQRQIPPQTFKTTSTPIPSPSEGSSRSQRRGERSTNRNSESDQNRGGRRRGPRQPAASTPDATNPPSAPGESGNQPSSTSARRNRRPRKGRETEASGSSDVTSTSQQPADDAPPTSDPSDGGHSSSASRSRNRNRRGNKNDSSRTIESTSSSSFNPAATAFVPSENVAALQQAPQAQPQSSGRNRRRGANGNASDSQPPQSRASRARKNFGSQLTIPLSNDDEHDNDHDKHQHGQKELPTSSLDLDGYFSGQDMSSNSLAVSILEDIHSGAYECMICINSITRKSKIWTCSTCYRVFHIHCIQKWGKQIKDTAAAAPGADPTVPVAWRCPGCQTARQEIPDKYRCWCGKVDNPDQSPLFPPHSCGQTCSYEYSNCPHVCSIPCHPGPHPKCSAMGPPLDCFCGKSTTQRRCVDTKYDGWSCGVVCGEMMACGVHTCPRPCHTGLCGPCEAPIHSSCYCGKEDKDVKCCQTLPARKSFFIDQDGDEAWWSAIWKCENVCDREFDCGVHHCQKSCHVQDIEPAHCPLSPDVVKTCPCGKHAVSEILGHERSSCEEVVPTCRDQCGKTLACGHLCKLVCHTGACGPCTEEVTVPCLCGHNMITLPCADLIFGTPRCRRICRIQLNCQRHECGQPCCPGEKLGQERLLKFRRKDVLQQQQVLEDIIEPQHICTATCNNMLKCGNHRCQITCHRGPCPPCLEASFEELTCNCGRTKMMPPIPCGTKPPRCKYQCTRVPACGHPAVKHNCHLDDEECPKCPYFVERRCMCGKSLQKNQPCSRQNVSCGNICNKLLSCGSHHCKKPCHREGECESPCKQPCGKTKSCGHPDELPCHSPFQCEEEKPCTAPIEIQCHCENLKRTVKCGATKTIKPPLRVIKCNDQCALLARNARLAEALNITAESHALASNAVTHSDITLRLYGTNKKWCESIEKIIDQFIVSAAAKRSLAFPPMRRQQRQFIHCLAEAYNLESESQDPEPHRSVVLHRTSRTALPDKNLAQAYAIWTKKQQAAGLTQLGSSSSSSANGSSMPLQMRRAPKHAYNAILLESVQFGLTRADLERKIERYLEPLADSKLRYTASWIADEDVVLMPQNAAELGFEPDDVERELAAIKYGLRKFIVTEQKLAQAAEMCWITRDNVIAYRESTVGKGSTGIGSGAWTSVPASSSSSSSNATAKARFTSYNVFAALGATANKSSASSSSTGAAAKAKKEPIADSWEDLDDEENEGSRAAEGEGLEEQAESSSRAEKEEQAKEDEGEVETPIEGSLPAVSADDTADDDTSRDAEEAPSASAPEEAPSVSAPEEAPASDSNESHESTE
ncbi:hypothetical protein BZA70DRAFT_185816 [Myxozyma melibiosi]|uniref:R3H domain-containing protein n=1 Tax=Myxozyma melibiosi TaxID=54550 RepID=A0ABR1F4Q1_9ASCO